MDVTKRYLPLFLVLVLVCSCIQAVDAKSALDPYAHIKPPAPKQKKSLAPPLDNVTTTSTYVTMPMGNLADNKSQGNTSTGLIGSMLGSVGDFSSTAANSIKAAGSGMVNGTRAAGSSVVKGSKRIGGSFMKGASVIGAGVMSTSDKLVDKTQSVGSKVAKRPAKQQSASKSSLNDLYTNQASKNIASSAQSAQPEKLIENARKSPGLKTSSYLKVADNNKKKKGFFPSFKKREVKNQPSPQSGFLEVMEEKKYAKKYSIPEPKKNATSQQSVAAKPSAVPEPQAKKSRFGFGMLSAVKIPGLNRKKAAQPAQQTTVAASTGQQSVADLAPKAPVAKPQIKTVASGSPVTPAKQVAAAPAPAQPKSTGRLSAVTSGLSRLNPFSRKKSNPPRTASKVAPQL